MNGNLAWYTARAAGLVSWFLLAASVTWGVLLSTRLLGKRPTARWLTDLHRFLGGLSVVFVGVHLLSLALDGYVHFGLVELLVPFTSTYRPAAVAWGIAGFYVLLAVEVTSLLRRRIPHRWWHGIHLASFGLFYVATIHLLTAGTDAGNVLLRSLAASTVLLVTGLTAYRALREKPSRVPAGARAAVAATPSRPIPVPVPTSTHPGSH